MSEDTQLVTIPEGATALAVFTEVGGVQPLLNQIRAHIDAFVPDMTTSRGRKLIAAMAYKVAQSKTLLEDVGKALADEQKAVPKKIDAARKLIKDTLDKWRDEVRKPLSDWEVDESDRVAMHENAVAAIGNYAVMVNGEGQPLNAYELAANLAAVSGLAITDAEEYADAYVNAKARSIASLKTALAARDRHEADRAELASLRAAQAERDAIAEAEREAARLRQAALQKIADDAWLADQEKALAERDAETARQKVILDEALAEKLKLGIELAASQAVAKAAAVEAARIEGEAHEARLKAAGVEHRRTINAAAAAALVAKGFLGRVEAERLVTLIIRDEIDFISINY